jgi:signal transduction histidine kinase
VVVIPTRVRTQRIQILDAAHTLAPMPPPRTGRFVSVELKLGIATVAVLAIAMIALFAWLRMSGRELLVSSQEQVARVTGELFLRTAATPIALRDASGIRSAAARLAADREVLGVQLWQVEDSQRITASLAAELKEGAAMLAPRWVSDAVIEREPDRIVFRGRVIDDDGRRIGIAALQFSLARVHAGITEQSHRMLIAAALIIVLLSIFLAAVARVGITGPLTRLLRAVHQVECGEPADLDAGAANDELGRLADAFYRMAETVQRRERDIARRNHDLRQVLDNVGQAFLVIEADGRMVSERSAIADRWFGAPRPDQLIGDFVRGIDGDAADLLELGLATLRAGAMPLDVCIDQLPARLRRGERHYACDYRAIAPRGTLEQLVLIISDVTGEVERERAGAAQRDVIAAVSRLIADRAGFSDFILEARMLVNRITRMNPLAEILRDLHTLKGTCAVYGLSGIAEFCHAMESQLAERGGLPTADDAAALNHLWGVLEDKVSAFTRSRPKAIELELDEHAEFAARLIAREPHAQLIETVARWIDDPVAPRLRVLAAHAVALARRLGKGRLEVEIEASGLRLPHEPWSRLWQDLSHVVRNAIDHGIESEAERSAAGKPPVARMAITVEQTAERLRFAVGDDGRGIDWAALRDRAERLGLPSACHDDLVVVMFTQGVTTRAEVGETSGRGVGLAALDQTVRALGGRITVDSAPGKGTRMVLDFPAPARRARELGSRDPAAARPDQRSASNTRPARSERSTAEAQRDERSES